MAWRVPDWIWTPPSFCRGEFEWVEESNGRVPSRAVLAGVDKDGGQIFVGRAWECNDLLPAKVCPEHGCAFVSYSGKQVEKDNYQVLVSDHVAWKDTNGSNIPPDAVRIGHTSDGEALYAGRCLHEGTLTVGKFGGPYVADNCHDVAIIMRIPVLPFMTIPVQKPANDEHTVQFGLSADGKYPLNNLYAVHPSHGCLYISWSGEELKKFDYEIMVLN